MKIKSIKQVAPELTVDIEVAETHTYQFSNGCVSHNTTSKLFGLTEGAHLPAMREYLRWVQFRNDDAHLQWHDHRWFSDAATDLSAWHGREAGDCIRSNS